MVTRFFSEPYLTINFIIAGICIFIFAYSGFFIAAENNHVIKCGVYEQTGKYCPTCGLSRGFSEIVRLNIHSAAKYNMNALPVFIFFFVQFILRIAFSFAWLLFHRKLWLIIFDAGISVLLLAYCFKGLIINY
jgi:hypothetical protein